MPFFAFFLSNSGRGLSSSPMLSQLSRCFFWSYRQRHQTRYNIDKDYVSPVMTQLSRGFFLRNTAPPRFFIGGTPRRKKKAILGHVFCPRLALSNFCGFPEAAKIRKCETCAKHMAQNGFFCSPWGPPYEKSGRSGFFPEAAKIRTLIENP